MLYDDLAAHSLEHLDDACDLFERRQISGSVLRVNFEKHAVDLKVFDAETGARLSHFAADLARGRDFLAHAAVVDDFRRWRRTWQTLSTREPEHENVLELTLVDRDEDALQAAEAEVAALIGDPIVSPEDLEDALDETSERRL